MSPIHFPPFNLLILAFSESEALEIVLDPESNSVEFDFCDDSSILRGGPWMIQNASAVIKVMLLHINRAAISESRTWPWLAEKENSIREEHTANE